MKIRNLFILAIAGFTSGSFALPLTHWVANGQNACATRFPDQKYCFPIHSEVLAKPNEIFIVQFSDSQTLFPLSQQDTGFTTSDVSFVLNTTEKLTIGTVLNHTFHPIKVVYNGPLGPNKVGLTCNDQGCTPWYH